MAKHTIVDWQANELIVASCSGRGSSLKFDSVSRQSFATDGDAAQNNAAQALKAAANELKFGKSDVVVVASREMVEVRTLSVPRIDADELPGVIRFQAQRQLANMSDSWTLDYVMLPNEPGQEMQTALVGAVSAEHMNAIEKACAGANLQVKHIALRPIEIARYAIQQGLSASGTGLVVSISQEQADILLLKDGQVVLVRGTKLPSDREQLAKVLGGEVRRSLMAASSQLGSGSIASAMLIAPDELSSAVEPTVSDACGTSVTKVDPGAMVPDATEDRDNLILQGCNRLAAIAGASQYTPADKKTSLDFKNPNRPAPKQKRTGLYILAAAAAVLVAVGGVSWWYNTNANLDEDLAMYEAEVEGKEDLVKTSLQKIKQLDEIESFMKASPNFLNIMTYMSEEMPDAEKLLMGSPSFSTTSDGKAQVRAAVAADSDRTLGKFGESLSDSRYKAIFREKRRTSDKGHEFYNWEATAILTVDGAGWEATPVVNEQPVESSESPESEAEGGEEATSPSDASKSASVTKTSSSLNS